MIAPATAAIPAGMASPEEAAKLAAYVERLTRYLTVPLTERLFGDEDVTDIQINSDGLVWLDRHSAGRVHEGDVLPPERVEMFVNAVAQHLGATFDARNSILEGELPAPVFLGSRLIALGPPTVARPAMVVRKPPLRIYTLDDYRASGILTAEQLDAVLGGILDHRNIVVCGATRSGKTTFLNAILAAVADLCPNERLVVVEDTLEVKSSVPNTQTLRTSQHKDHHDLLKATLRLSPDRIVFGEVRDKAVLALLDAWTTDHSGFATFHAADAEGALRRMNRLAMRNRVPPQLELVAEAVHVLVLIQGGSVKRHVREVVRVSGFDPRERRFSFQRLA